MIKFQPERSSLQRHDHFPLKPWPLDSPSERLPYPWRDNDPENKYFIEDDSLDRNHPVLSDRTGGFYQAMSARGCPYKCTYCCEATFKDLYKGEQFLRRRSPEDLVAELAETKKRFGITKIQFDDEIFGMGRKWLEVFTPLYIEKVNLPFTAFIYPTKGVETILTLLKKAGLEHACLALESGSERINKEVFDRVYDRKLFLHTADVCHKLGISFYTDVITYNPYENEEDLKKTLDVLMEIPSSYDICINKIFVLPGTKMAEQMIKDGKKIGASEMDRTFNYYCRLYWMASFGPRARNIVKLIDKTPWFKKHEWLLNPAVVEGIVEPLKGLGTVMSAVLPARTISALEGVWERIESVLPKSTSAAPAN